MRVVLIILLIFVNSFALDLQDYLSTRFKDKVEMLDSFKFGVWKVYIIWDDNQLKTVFMKKDSIKEFYGLPEITDENYIKIKIGYYKVFPDGRIKAEDENYPKILKEKDYGNFKIILKKFTSGGIPRLYVKTPDIEKRVVEFNGFDFFKNDKYAYIDAVKYDYFYIYRIVPSTDYIYDLEEIFKLKRDYDYRIKIYYCDGNVFYFVYNTYTPDKAYGYLFDIKKEKVKKVFQVDRWDRKSKKIIGCVNKKIYILENSKLKVYSLDLKSVHNPKIVKLKPKGIKLSKRTLNIDGCVRIIEADKYIVIRTGKENKTNLYIFDKKFTPLKSISLRDVGDIYFVNGDIYTYSHLSDCLYKIFPTYKQIKCSKTPTETIIPAERNSLIYSKSTYKSYVAEENGYIKIERDGKIIWEKTVLLEDRLIFDIFPNGIFVEDVKANKFYFIDLDGNKKLLNVKGRLKRFGKRTFIYSDGTYIYKFFYREKRFKPLTKGYFLTKDGYKVSCYISQNIIVCGKNIYSFEDGRKLTEIKGENYSFRTGLICYTNGYLLGEETRRDKSLLKFIENGIFVDYMPVEESSKIKCLKEGFLKIIEKRNGLSTQNCKTTIEYYKIYR